MDGVQLPQGMSHFEEAVYFLPLSSQNFLVLILSREDERLSQPWSHPVVLSMGPLDWESSALTTRPLLQFSFIGKINGSIFLLRKNALFLEFYSDLIRCVYSSFGFTQNHLTSSHYFVFL